MYFSSVSLLQFLTLAVMRLIISQIYKKYITHTCVYEKKFLYAYLAVLKAQENISAIDQYVIDIVRELRIYYDLSQGELGSVLGFGKSFVGNVESVNHRAKYNLTHINIIADYFDLTPGFFLPNNAIVSTSKKQRDILRTEIQDKISALKKKKR